MASLYPRMTIGDSIAEPLRVFRPLMTRAERDQEVEAMMTRVGLFGANGFERHGWP